MFDIENFNYIIKLNEINSPDCTTVSSLYKFSDLLINLRYN